MSDPLLDMLSGDLPVCSLDKTMTREEVQEYAASLDKVVKQKNRGMILTVSGWDDQPEGLHEIPEAVEFLKMVMDTGFFSLLEVTTTMPYEGNPWANGLCPGIGAFEAWMIATGGMQRIADEYVEKHGDPRKGNKPPMGAVPNDQIQGEVDQKLFGEFVAWLRGVSNGKLEESIEQAKARGPIHDSPAFTLDKDGISDTSVDEYLTGKKKSKTGSQRMDPMAPLQRSRPNWLR
jgi:hypothetical protein